MEPQQIPPQYNPGAATPQPPQAFQPPPNQPPLPPQPMQPDYQAATLPKTKKIPTWVKILFIVIILLIALVGGLAVIVNNATKNAVKVSNQFVADVQVNNDNAAYGLTAPAFKKADTQGQFTQIISNVYLALQGPVSVTGKTINKTGGQPDQAVIVYSVKTSAGTKYIQTVLQDNTTWQVLAFRSSDKPFSLTLAK
jgi:hypothetical protein